MYTHLDRSVYLSGALAPYILVNGIHQFKSSDYGVQMVEEINIDNVFLQGGPGKSVSEFEKKIISGNIDFPLRVKENGQLEDGVEVLLNCGQNYKTYCSLTSIVPYTDTITSEGSAYISNSNSLVFDVCLIETTTIKVSKDGNVNVSLTVLGQVDDPNTAALAAPVDLSELYRTLSWYDFFLTKNGSQMENLFSFEIKIIKELDQQLFLFNQYDADIRFDRPYSTGVRSVKVEFIITEHITSLLDIFNYSLGGYDSSADFNGNFGPLLFTIPKTTLKISSQQQSSKIIERITSGFYQMRPDTPDNPQFLFQGI